MIAHDPQMERLIDLAINLQGQLNAFDEGCDDLLKWYYDKLHELGTYDELDADLKDWYVDWLADKAEQERLGIIIN